LKFALGVISHTPLWMWILFACLVWQGIKAMGSRKSTIWRALIVPVIFIIWGLFRAFDRYRRAPGEERRKRRSPLRPRRRSAAPRAANRRYDDAAKHTVTYLDEPDHSRRVRSA